MPTRKYDRLNFDLFVTSSSGFDLANLYKSNRRHREIIRPGMTISPRPSRAKSDDEPDRGARSLMGASREVATSTITGVPNT
jgi:hypothetical protein